MRALRQIVLVLIAVFLLVQCAAGDPPERLSETSAAATCTTQWDPSWQQGSGANNWWVEYAITGVGTVSSAHLEVVGVGNVPLQLRFDKWVGPSSNIATGAQVIVHAVRSDGQQARTQAFGYLVTTQPVTQCATDCAYNPSWQQGSGANNWWVEYVIGDSTVTSAHLEVVGVRNVPLQLRFDKWLGPTARIDTGASVVVHATNAAGQSARTQVFRYLVDTQPVTLCDSGSGGSGGSCDFRPTWQQESGANNWWIEYAIAGGTVTAASLEVVGVRTVPLSFRFDKWVGSTARIDTGTSVVVHATNSLGQTAKTLPFRYLVDTRPASAPCANSPPTANAGSDRNVTTGSSVTLDGSGSSDPDGDPLTYAWSFSSRPSGSTAQLSSATAIRPSFTADRAGAYVLSLVVNDGQVGSAADTVTITATSTTNACTINASEGVFANDVGLLPDGRIVTVGTTDFFTSELRRFNPDGTGGVPIARFEGAARGLAVQADGRVVIVGNNIVTNVLFLRRYTGDGVPDASFGTGGLVVFGGGTSEPAQVVGVALQPDGKILATMGVTRNFTVHLLLARYNANGTLDGSFGTAGVAEYPTSSAGRKIAVQADGKIVVAGFLSNPSGLLVRYNANGTLDGTFGVNGVAATPPNDRPGPGGIVIQPDGRIVVAGTGGDDEISIAMLLRYTSGGVLDPSFGNGGVVVHSEGGFGMDVALQADGKLLLSGTSGVAYVARYQPNGTRDLSFHNGLFTFDGGDPEASDWATSMVLPGNGTVVAAGGANQKPTMTVPVSQHLLLRLSDTCP